jgi:hypothetical protein
MLNLWNSSQKGQGIIGEVIIFGVVIFISIMIFVLLSSSDRNFKQEAEVNVKASMETIHYRSILTEAFNDKIGKIVTMYDRTDADEVIDSNVYNKLKNEPSHYGELKGITLTSHYLSTTRDTLNVNGTEYERDLMEKTLEDYYEAKIYSSFRTSTNYRRPSFSIEIIEEGQRLKAKYTNEPGPLSSTDGSPTRMILPLQLSNDTVADVQFTVISTGGVFTVE